MFCISVCKHTHTKTKLLFDCAWLAIDFFFESQWPMIEKKASHPCFTPYLTYEHTMV